MKEMFQKTMASLCAIVAFSGAGAAIVNGASSLLDYKVDTVLVKRQNDALAAKLAAEDNVSVVDATVSGIKKLGKVLQ